MEDISPATTHSLFTEEWNTTSAGLGGGGGGLTIDPFPLQFLTFAQTLLPIYHPTLLCIGTIGNVMTVVIMKRLTSDDSTINIYFTAIAVVDLIFLWSIVPNQIVHFNLGYDFKTVHGFVCKIITWLYTGGGTVSCWYLVCMTVHRAMSVVWPHRVNVLCTRRTVLIMLSAVTVIIALLYSHYLVGYDVVTLDNGVTYKCSLETDDYIHFHTNVFVYVELLVYCVVPFIVLVIANGVLTWKLVASAKKANLNLSEGSSGQARSREKAANSVTLTVMAVSLTFLVLTLPSSLNFIINYLYFTGHTQGSGSREIVALASSIVCTLLTHTNHAVNFYLYCLTGRRFREEFLKVLCCGRGGRRLCALSWKETASG
ncbi:hypothetical protein ACOMHN_041967 [Nucella lapillus]